MPLSYIGYCLVNFKNILSIASARQFFPIDHLMQPRSLGVCGGTQGRRAWQRLV